MAEKKQKKAEKSKKKDSKKDEKKGEEKDEKELLKTLQFLQAEFENYKKRVEKEREGFVKSACADIVNELLPILDNFELALQNTSDHKEFVKGVELLYSQLFSTLEKTGLKAINPVEKKFDPYYHEALLQEESDKDEGEVIEVLQKGYMLGEKVIRHAKVKVSRGKHKKGD